MYQNHPVSRVNQEDEMFVKWNTLRVEQATDVYNNSLYRFAVWKKQLQEPTAGLKLDFP